MIRSFFFLIFFLFMFGCGYQAEKSSLVSVHVPFVRQDRKGLFTEKLIYAISSKPSCFQYDVNARLILKGELVFSDDEKIGFRQDRDKKGKLKKDLVPIEGRKKIQVRITLENREGKILWGPTLFSEEGDYDYVDQDSYQDLTVSAQGQQESLLDFSLGQLESIEAAQEASENMIYQKLAKRIVEALYHNCPLKDF